MHCNNGRGKLSVQICFRRELIGASFVLLAAFVTWRFLPARAPAEPGELVEEDIEVARALASTDA